jgi:hypothetical protein
MKVRQVVVLGAVVSALGIAAVTVAAYAAVPIPDAKGIIRACVKYEDINRYEQVRWITKTTCPKGEKLITWNQKGRTGPQGPQGEQGIQGPQGVPGSNAPVPYLQSHDEDFGSANEFGSTALCPPGEVAVGGGGTNSSHLLEIIGEGPVTISGQSGWNIQWATRDGSSLDPPVITTYATCIANPPI